MWKSSDDLILNKFHIQMITEQRTSEIRSTPVFGILKSEKVFAI
jgi:hypothetical protein